MLEGTFDLSEATAAASDPRVRQELQELDPATLLGAIRQRVQTTPEHQAVVRLARTFGQDGAYEPSTLAFNLYHVVRGIEKGKIKKPTGIDGWAEACADEYLANLRAPLKSTR